MRCRQILLIIFLILSSQISFATNYYIAITVLNVRKGSGAQYAIAFTLQKGEEVEVLSKAGSWYRINYLGKTGYAHSKFLEYNRTVSDKFLDTPNEKHQILW